MRQRTPRQHLTLPRVSRETYYRSLGHPRQYGRWTRTTMLVALGLYVRHEHRLPPHRHLHNSEYLPSYDTAAELFGSIAAYYAALPLAWQAPIRTALPRAQYPPRLRSGDKAHGGRILCLKCNRAFDSVDTTYNRICPLCALVNAREDGMWLTGEVCVEGSAIDTWEEVDLPLTQKERAPRHDRKGTTNTLLPYRRNPEVDYAN